MGINISISREVELIMREKEKEEEKEGENEGGKKISSELVSIARELDSTLNDLEHDVDRFKNKMHESGLDSEFGEIKSDLRSKLSSFLSY